MKRTLALLLLIIGATVTYSQQNDTINISDGMGRKQGYWISKYPDGTIRYEGFFRDDNPVGLFRRYDENGVLKSEMYHQEDGKEVRVKFFHANGFPAAEGIYIDQKKEGKWSYYSERTEDYLICEEHYRLDLRNGTSLKYYRDGVIAERLTFINDLREGEWTQYYVTGKLCIRGHYSKGKLNGSFEVYYANGKPEYLGQYSDDVRDGLWQVFREDGSKDIELAYKMGRVDDPKLAERENAFLDFLEKNRGKLSDPEITGTIWN